MRDEYMKGTNFNTHIERIISLDEVEASTRETNI